MTRLCVLVAFGLLLVACDDAGDEGDNPGSSSSGPNNYYCQCEGPGTICGGGQFTAYSCSSAKSAAKSECKKQTGANDIDCSCSGDGCSGSGSSGCNGHVTPDGTCVEVNTDW